MNWTKTGWFTLTLDSANHRVWSLDWAIRWVQKKQSSVKSCFLITTACYCLRNNSPNVCDKKTRCHFLPRLTMTIRCFDTGSANCKDVILRTICDTKPISLHSEHSAPCLMLVSFVICRSILYWFEICCFVSIQSAASMQVVPECQQEVLCAMYCTTHHTSIQKLWN